MLNESIRINMDIKNLNKGGARNGIKRRIRDNNVQESAISKDDLEGFY